MTCWQWQWPAVVGGRASGAGRLLPPAPCTLHLPTVAYLALHDQSIINPDLHHGRGNAVARTFDLNTQNSSGTFHATNFANLAKLIFDNGDLLAMIGSEDVVDQGGFPGACRQKSNIAPEGQQQQVCG